MRKINSIGFGYIFLIAIGLFLAIIPALVYLLRSYLGTPLFQMLLRGSLILGSLILLAFIIILTIELHQDRKLNRYYAENQNRKLELNDGNFECQACGNTHLGESDTFCPVCGMRFDAARK